MSIDVEELKGRNDIVAVVGAFVALKKRGAEYVGLCPFHSEKTPSFWVIPAKQFCHCFGCGANHDVVSFIQEIEGLDFKAACERLGAKQDWPAIAPIQQERREPLPPRNTAKPPTGTAAPSMAISALGEPSRIWPYRDVDGTVLGYVARYETPEGKQIRCWTWGQRGEKPARWECGHWSKPRPLYGLDRLAARPDNWVLVVEGEKAADAAQTLLPDFVAITFPGGADSWRHTNWSPMRGRKVVLWPDNDGPGIKCATKIADILSSLECLVWTLDPKDMSDGFDAADWVGTTNDLILWAKSRASKLGQPEKRR